MLRAAGLGWGVGGSHRDKTNLQTQLVEWKCHVRGPAARTRWRSTRLCWLRSQLALGEPQAPWPFTLGRFPQYAKWWWRQHGWHQHFKLLCVGVRGCVCLGRIILKVQTNLLCLLFSLGPQPPPLTHPGLGTESPCGPKGSGRVQQGGGALC